jgi:hypothetical protein
LLTLNPTVRHLSAYWLSIASPIDLSLYPMPELRLLELSSPHKFVLAPLVARLPALRLRLEGLPSAADMASPAVAAAVERIAILDDRGDRGPGNARFVAACTSLTELSVSRSMRDVELLPACIGVRSLSLSLCTTIGASLLAFTNLHSLSLYHCDLTLEVMASVAVLPHLKELSVNPFELGKHSALQHLVTHVRVVESTPLSGLFPRLQRLDWRLGSFTAAAVSQLLPRMPSLRHLCLVWRKGGTKDEGELRPIVSVAAAAGIELLEIIGAIPPVCPHASAFRELAPWMHIHVWLFLVNV